MIAKTTLNEIRKGCPCDGGWEQLLSYLGKTGPDDEPLPLATVLESNGVEDAIWCLRTVPGIDREVRLFAVWCARQAQAVSTDRRFEWIVAVAERYADGNANSFELERAQKLAKDPVVWSACRHNVYSAAYSTARKAVVAITNAATTAASSSGDSDSDLIAVSVKSWGDAQAAQAEKFREMFCTPTEDDK